MRLKQFKKSNYKTGEKDEANGDLTGNKVANKITKYSQQSNAETVTNQNHEETPEETRKESYIPSEERQEIIDNPTLI